MIITVLLIKLNQSFKVYKNKLRMIETIKIIIDADAKGAKDEMKTSWILETGLLLFASSRAFIATLYFVLTLNMSLLKQETKCIDIEHRVLYVMVKFSLIAFKNNINIHRGIRYLEKILLDHLILWCFYFNANAKDYHYIQWYIVYNLTQI